MSYILEALKKAQAERQLGNAPTIHAPQPVQAAPASTAASRRPLLIGVAAGVLVASAVAVVALRQQAPVQVAALAPPPATAPVPAAPVSAVPQAPAAQTASVPVPPARQKGSVAEAARVAPAAPAAPAAQLANPEPVRQARRAPTPDESRRETPRVHVAAEDKVRNLNELPEAIQREVPRVVFGGYIYSPNPADRLLLIDKMLRHEGEEVAPGLVLEKLQPKGAVMNYRGYRYRVAY
jgi:general secretion pathway protein B